MYSFLHSIFYRIVIKLKKIKKKASWSKVPIQEKTTFFSDEFMLYEPHLAGASTFANQIQDIETTKEVLKTLDLLSPGEPSLEFVKDFYRKGIENFGDSWKYADISSAVYVFSKMLSVENYLEVGVRRGRSMTVFASQSKNANIFGFDKWIKNYAGSENPGESLVREELNKVGFEGSLKIIDGDSKKTIPSFFKENPDLYFDVITIDGDHSIKGAKRDLNNTVKRLKIGGVIIFDDISSQEHPYLKKVWEKNIKNRDNLYSFEFDEIGLGVAFAIRKY